jgi:raffinose/stachyose/melibiose transport system substrate-binding protein
MEETGMKKLFRALLILTMVSTLLCSGTVLAQGAQASSGEEPVELEFFVQPTLYFDTFQYCAGEFSKQNPGITINVTQAPNPEAVLQTRVQLDDVPDIVGCWSSAADFKSYAKEGYFLDLTGQEFLNRVNRDYLATLEIDGKNYSLPYNYTAVGLFCNNKMFDELGLSLPTTYGELIATAKTFQANGIDAFAFLDKDNWSCGKLNTPLFANFMTNGGKEFFEGLMDGSVKAGDNEEYRKIAQRILELRTYGIPDSLGIDYTTALNAFLNEEVPMIIMGVWAYESAASAGLDFTVIAFPGDTVDGAYISVTVDVALAISANTKDADAALQFLEYMSSPEIAAVYCEMRPSPMLISGVTIDAPEMSSFLSIYDEGKVYPWMQDLWPAGIDSEYYAVVQNFIMTGDFDAFYAATDALFAGAK